MEAMEEVHGDVPQLQRHFWAAAYQIALFRDALALSRFASPFPTLAVVLCILTACFLLYLRMHVMSRCNLQCLDNCNAVRYA